MKYECEWCYKPIYDGPPCHRVDYDGTAWYTHRHCTPELLDDLSNERFADVTPHPKVTELSTAQYVEEVNND